ncbi:hypothetical protein VFPPC_17935 [Pochonia chlamydosporia 170]|uniref:Uncharacterized protein n=1 Tax=Pochonia chlamydosporia 170 TaxID=1380566 RepID=A0A219AQJ0_METCM|nr:hypothetical protein VFPPC_17935 [Pochonia chlamydosporia 170]OWT42872.1 hypothetical protein VFPPC_17935 [Pochonia chlamydosporia 170]
MFGMRVAAPKMLVAHRHMDNSTGKIESGRPVRNESELPERKQLAGHNHRFLGRGPFSFRRDRYARTNNTHL